MNARQPKSPPSSAISAMTPSGKIGTPRLPLRTSRQSTLQLSAASCPLVAGTSRSRRQSVGFPYDNKVTNLVRFLTLLRKLLVENEQWISTIWHNYCINPNYEFRDRQRQ